MSITLKERISNVIQPGESVSLPEVVSRLAAVAVKLKADPRRALETLAREEVAVAKNRTHFLHIETLKLSERYLRTTDACKVWMWRITPAGTAWLAEHK